ncbi:sensor histidine kinase [bacterium]|nr:sensor histidine kinase [bacterium]
MMKGLRAFFHIPEFASEQDTLIARILGSILLILPIPFVIFVLNRITFGDTVSARVIVCGYLILNSSFLFIKARRLKSAIFIIALSLMSMITIITTRGQGIHDITIVGFPGVLIVMSLMLNRRLYALLTFITIMAIAWLTLGDYYNVYTPLQLNPGDPTDFLIVATIVLVCSLMANLLAKNMRRSLDRALEEIERRKEITRELEKNLREKEDLLKEVHHRVKNNLTVITSLINLQERQMKNKDQAFKAFQEIRDRIFAMAQVHEKLYKSDSFSHISLRQYTENLANHLFTIYATDKQITRTLDIDDIELKIELAVPCGMLINEILINSLKHAFIKRKTGQIAIDISRLPGNRCTIVIQDNGPGLPKKVNTDDPDSLGLKLIDLLTQQVNGELTITNDNGARFEVVFPVG